MFTLQKLSIALVGTAVIFMGANPAGAVSLTQGGSTPVVGEGQYTNIQGAQTINFNNGIAPSSGVVNYSATNGIVQGSVGGQYATPFGNTSKFLTISPKNDKVSGNDFAGNSGDVTISFAQSLDYFGFYWGSIDTYNFVDVYSKGNLLRTFSGADVPGAPANGEQSGSTNNVYVNLLADTSKGETFDKVVLRSTGRAFETDNHSYRLASVPESSSTLGLLAFGILSAGSFVKRKSKTA
ncbi:Npun_F0296 family exosortase-dependent surface protein [aff. Roholtiella sp. LEGE 12411]|uniref:Npun_F0296 family exosortase-dependent surface protein n=1 Tax=aff. Roholtiella sp. LEGE 12411 TaxID=1828822 RepID=UPI00187F6B11|nr:PEP-CTERM sorting domain-containing protein [aff. Roholtiella sp. LEGE 12411]MBE9034862.1 PEP-CTERM sorting domain-containing protein [aff. Roholtiella sp. LEGE 12411]